MHDEIWFREPITLQLVECAQRPFTDRLDVYAAHSPTAAIAFRKRSVTTEIAVLLIVLGIGLGFATDKPWKERGSCRTSRSTGTGEP